MSQAQQQSNDDDDDDDDDIELVVPVSAAEVLAAAARLRKQVSDPATTGSVHEIHGDNFTGMNSNNK